MKLDLNILQAELSRYYATALVGKPADGLDIEGVRFYTGQPSLCPGMIHLLEGCWPAPDARGCFLCREPQGPAPADFNGAILAVRTGEPLTAIANRLFALFDQYTAWDRSLQQGVDDNVSLREMVRRGVALIPGRVLVSDKGLQLLADSRYCTGDGGQPEDLQGRALPEDVVKAILSEDPRQGLQGDLPYYIAGKKGQYGSLCYCVDLHIADRPEATCTLMEEDGPLPPYALPLFLHFTGYIRKSFLYHHGTVGRTERPLRQLAAELLSDEAPSAALRQEAAGYNGRFFQYRCVLLDAAAQPQLSAEYICAQCEALFEGSIAVIQQEQVVLLIPQFSRQMRQAALGSIATHSIPAGISQQRNRLAHCRMLYLQAREALRLGLRINPEALYYPFDDYLLEYLLQNGTGDLPPAFLRTEGFAALLAFDSRTKTDYLGTLRAWLDHECHVTETAQTLYLHRSSFLKRLEKLQSILGAELDTPRGRLLLRIQLQMHRA